MKKSNTVKTISAEEFDQLADSGSNQIDQYLDWENASRAGLEIKRTTLDFPTHVLQKVDREAALRGRHPAEPLKNVDLRARRKKRVMTLIYPGPA